MRKSSPIRIAVSLSLAIGFAVPAIGQTEVDSGPEPYPARVQHADGHWSAASGGGQVEADLRVTSLMLLAELGDGSTLRSGPMRQSVQLGVRWLRGQQDTRGRFALRADPEWLLDHTIATYGLAEAMRLSTYPTLAPTVREAAAAVRLQIDTVRPMVGVEMRLWGELLVRTLRAEEQRMQQQAAEDPLTAAGLGAEPLAQSLGALKAGAADTPREQAAQFLRDVLAGKTAAVAPAQWLEAPLQDPLLSFYAYAGLYLAGGEEFRRVSPRLIQTLVAAQRDNGEPRGTWDPVGEFGERNGRLGTTAGATLLLEVYYRYCRLEVVSSR